jgi:hypothetical protein
MKKFFSLLLLISASTWAVAQSVDLDKFTEVSASAGHEITLIKADDNYAEVEMIKGKRENFELYVKGNTLYAKTKSGLWNSAKAKAVVKVYYTESITDIDVSSAARVESVDVLYTERLNIEVSSAGRCTLEVESDELDVDISSGGRVSVTGVTGSQTVDVSSGARFDGKDMQSDYTVAEASSGAKAEVHTNKKLKADCSSGGSIVYHGNPKDVDAESGKWSGGSIKAARK